MIRVLLLLALALGTFSSAPSATAQQLTEARFRELHALLQPSNDELWRTIPWKISLLDAQRLAANERKPIFIWAMDGHPLGCT